MEKFIADTFFEEKIEETVSSCTCHPDDAPTACQQRYALTDCLSQLNYNTVDAANYNVTAISSVPSYVSIGDFKGKVVMNVPDMGLVAIDSLPQKLYSLNSCMEIQCSPGNYDVDEYMRGMANGLILAKSIMFDENPQYINPPEGNSPVKAEQTPNLKLSVEVNEIYEMGPANHLKSMGMDGQKWARDFNIIAQDLGYPKMDEGWLIGWFANAIMAGWDHANWARDRYEGKY